MERDKQIDTMKAWLIFFVVLGHMIELTPSWLSSMLHNFIYSFHMPVFIFIAGMFSKSADIDKYAVRIVKGILIPLILFTLIYEGVWYYKTLSFPSMFTKSLQPFWVLWFMVSLLTWKLFAPLLSISKYPLITSIVISVVAMTYSGYIAEFSLTRSMYFLPYFILGYQYGDKVVGRINSISRGRPVGVSSLSFLILLFVSYYANSDISSGKASFIDMKIGVLNGLISVFLLYVAFVMALIVLLRLSTITTKICTVGERSINVYLWHGVIIYALSSMLNKEYVNDNPVLSITVSVLASIVLTYTLSTKYVHYFTNVLQLPLSYLLVKRKNYGGH